MEALFACFAFVCFLPVILVIHMLESVFLHVPCLAACFTFIEVAHGVCMLMCGLPAVELAIANSAFRPHLGSRYRRGNAILDQ
jgi:hypothetical protein